MGKSTIIGIALLAVFAVTAVLVSPMPDELPGTTIKHGVLGMVVAVHSVSCLGDVQSNFGPALAFGASPTSVDRLALTCARLC